MMDKPVNGKSTHGLSARRAARGTFNSHAYGEERKRKKTDLKDDVISGIPSQWSHPMFFVGKHYSLGFSRFWNMTDMNHRSARFFDDFLVSFGFSDIIR